MKISSFILEATANHQVFPTLDDNYYDNYPSHDIDNNDDDSDEDQSWAGSKVADKANDAILGTYEANSQLVNDNGDRIVVQSFFSFPWINDHQLYDERSDVDKKLAANFNNSLSKFPTIPKGTQNKIQYDTESMKRALLAATSVVISTFQQKNLAKFGNYPIFWVNPEMRSRSTSFGLSHWIKIPKGIGDLRTLRSYSELKQYSNKIEHYIFGFYNTAGIDTTEFEPKRIMAAFNVGTIERIMNYYGIGGDSLKRLSALKPNRILGMNAQGYNDQTELEGLDYRVSGKVLKNPWTDLRQSISNVYKNRNPVKYKKLIEITDQIIGKTITDSVKYPIVIKDISVKEVGFSASSLTVDFMEILHPMLVMKPNGVINNGVYNAAHAFLSSENEGGKRTFNLQECVVAYPDAANAKLFDSMIINPRTGGRLLISSKEGEGAAPTAASLGSVWNELSKELQNQEFYQNVDPEFRSFILKDHNNPRETQFRELLRFFQALAKGTSEETVNQLLPKNQYAKALAMKMLGRDSNIAALLNTWNGNNSYSSADEKGSFLKYCSRVLRYTPLVQVNTEVDKPGKEEYDREDTIKINGFLATWPNKIFDDISFQVTGESNILRFKINVGGASGEISSRVANVRNKRGEITDKRQYVREPNWNKWKGRDYSGQMKYSPRYTYNSKINSMAVPGYIKRRGRQEFQGTWYMLVNDLSKKYEDVLDKYEDVLEAKPSTELISLYNLALNFIKQYGHDPGTSTPSYDRTGLTNRQLISKIAELLK